MPSTAAPASPEAPIYRMLPDPDSGATQLWYIEVDEGWRSSIVCERMYVWAAEWMLIQLGRRPYAPDRSGSPASAA